MEIKITISDTPSVSGTSPISIEIPGSSSSGVDSRAVAAPQSQSGVYPPQELLQKAAAIGAINAGPAPNLLSGSEAGAPMPFVNVNANIVASAAAGQSAGAAPGSGAVMETFTVEHRGDE